MSQRFLYRTRRPMPSHQRPRPKSLLLLALSGLVLTILFTCPSATADVRWQELWTDNFDHSMNDGWQTECFMKGDRLMVVREGYTEPSRGLYRCDNNVLYGRSLDREPGHGFAARSPKLADLGLDRHAQAYSIEFRYMIIGSEVCWTVPLASPHATLMISECNADGTHATLGIVDEKFSNFRRVTTLPVDEWVDISIRVHKLNPSGAHDVSTFVNGVLVDRALKIVPNPYERVIFMDLPAFPANREHEESNPIVAGGFFGSGYWDDVKITALQNDNTSDGKPTREVHVAPSPFNPATTVSTWLEAAVPLEIGVFDVRGCLMRSLWSGWHDAGNVELRWNGRDGSGREAGSGVYFFRVGTPQDLQVVRAVLVR